MSRLIVIDLDEIEALPKYDYESRGYMGFNIWASLSDGKKEYIRTADLLAMLDKAKPCEAVEQFEKANRLRFFRDLTDAERMKVFKAFGLIPQDYSGFIHLSTQMLFFKKWQSPQPAIPQWKDHNTRELTNAVTDIAKQFAGTQQLRDRISIAIKEYIQTKAQPAIPEGYVLVPIEPTDAMVLNAINTFGGVIGSPENLANSEYVNRMLDRQKKAVIGNYKAMINEAVKG